MAAKRKFLLLDEKLKAINLLEKGSPAYKVAEEFGPEEYILLFTEHGDSSSQDVESQSEDDAGLNTKSSSRRSSQSERNEAAKDIVQSERPKRSPRKTRSSSGIADDTDQQPTKMSETESSPKKLPINDILKDTKNDIEVKEDEKTMDNEELASKSKDDENVDSKKEMNSESSVNETVEDSKSGKLEAVCDEGSVSDLNKNFSEGGNSISEEIPNKNVDLNISNVLNVTDSSSDKADLDIGNKDIRKRRWDNKNKSDTKQDIHSRSKDIKIKLKRRTSNQGSDQAGEQKGSGQSMSHETETTDDTSGTGTSSTDCTESADNINKAKNSHKSEVDDSKSSQKEDKLEENDDASSNKNKAEKLPEQSKPKKADAKPKKSDAKPAVEKDEQNEKRPSRSKIRKNRKKNGSSSSSSSSSGSHSSSSGSHSSSSSGSSKSRSGSSSKSRSHSSSSSRSSSSSSGSSSEKSVKKKKSKSVKKPSKVEEKSKSEHLSSKTAKSKVKEKEDIPMECSDAVSLPKPLSEKNDKDSEEIPTTEKPESETKQESENKKGDVQSEEEKPSSESSSPEKKLKLDAEKQSDESKSEVKDHSKEDSSITDNELKKSSDTSSVEKNNTSEVMKKRENTPTNEESICHFAQRKAKRILDENLRWLKRSGVSSEKSGDTSKLPEKIQRKRRWGSSTKSKNSNAPICISTQSLKGLLPEVKPALMKIPDLEEEVVQKKIVDNSSARFSRTITHVTEENSNDSHPTQPKQDSPKNPPSSVILISNLVRPFTVNQLKELLAKTGKICNEKGFWIDKIKSKCLVKYESTDDAIKTRNSLHDTKWPASNPKLLSVDYSTEEALDIRLEHTNHSGPISKPEKEKERKLERKKPQDESSAPIREWDRHKLTQSPDRNDRHKRRRHSSGHDKREETSTKEEEPPAKLLDDLFRKTKATPCIYWLPLTDELVKERIEERKKRDIEREKRRQQRQVERNAPRSAPEKARNSSDRRRRTRSRSPSNRRR
ncbi:Apoptotic chromatin condensation inducer in the nucleus [Nymphon striatum]|nr:Apoptotic chromatin condensation inducer in the nucleus [Nymphon striatum]